MATEQYPVLGDSPRRDYQSQQWTKDDKGRLRPPELQADFLEWLLTDEVDRSPKTQKEWCEQHDVSPTTAKHWKRDGRFRSEWERRARAQNISTERIQAVLDSVWRAAKAGDTTAQKTYLQYVERFLPPPQVSTEDELRDMTDEELLEALQAEAELDG